MLRRAASGVSKLFNMPSFVRRFLSTRGEHPLPVRFLGRIEQSHPHTPLLKTVTPYAYRGDRRSFEIIQGQNGFVTGNSNFRLDHHTRKGLQKDEQGKVIGGLYDPSGYVSTTLSEQTADEFANISHSNLKTVFALARPMIHVAPFYDVSNQIGMARSVAIAEAEISAIRSIAFSEIVAYKQPNSGSSFGPWILSPHFIPRNFSIAIRSADEAEAKVLGKSLPYFYPLYSTAKIIADLLNQAGREYNGTAKFMTCFEELRAEEVEKTLERSVGSGFSESDLPRYYEVTFHQVQREMGRKRINTFFGGPGTLFAVTPSLPASTSSSTEAATREEVIAHLKQENSLDYRHRPGFYSSIQTQVVNEKELEKEKEMAIRAIQTL